MAAEEHQIFLLRKIFRDTLVEGLTLRCHVDHSWFLSDLLHKGLVSAVNRLCLHDHPGSSSVWIIIHLAVALQRIITDVHCLK